MKHKSIPPQPDENFLSVSGDGMINTAKDKNKKTADHRRIDLRQPYELAYWSRKFGVPPERLTEAIHKVGTNAGDVAIELGKPL